MTLLIITGILKSFNDPIHKLEWQLLSMMSFCILYLAIMLRQHYALGNQDRIVRLEFRLRYFEIFGKSALNSENKLSFGQIAALRFAHDKQFVELVSRAVAENLPAEDIKRAITDWQADKMRV